MTSEKPACEGGTPVRSKKLYYSHQYIDQHDIGEVVRVLKSDFLTTGPDIASCEKKLCEVTGARYAVMCTNDTAALHIAMMAAGVGPGDEVITTPLTFAADANCVRFVGAMPVFADVNPETYNIDPGNVESLITERTKAVIAVDFGGQAVPEEEFLRICHEHHLVYVEDAAHSIGTAYKGAPIGSFADMTTFSFHAVKTITGGEGGAVVTDNKDLYDRLVLYRTHAITHDPAQMTQEPDGPWYYQQLDLAPNYRLTDMQAALIESQLCKLQEFGERKKAIVRRYDEAFSRLPGLFVQKETPGSDTVRHLYIIRVNPEHLQINRRQLFDALGAENIICNVHYIPTYYFPYYQKLGYKKGLCPNAEHIYEGIITIPLYYAMSDQDVDDVIHAVTKIVTYYQK